MKFKVLKSSFSGISGGESDFLTIENVLREIFDYRGWSSLADLHAAIKKWADNAKLGDVFCTRVTAIVVTAANDFYEDEDTCIHCGGTGLEYDCFDTVEGGTHDTVEQRVECTRCEALWVDVFTLTGQRVLRKGADAPS